MSTGVVWHFDIADLKNLDTKPPILWWKVGWSDANDDKSNWVLLYKQ